MAGVDGVKVGLLGCGTVGGGVAKLLAENEDEITQKLGVPVRVKKILVRDTSKERKVPVDPTIFTDNIQDILNDEEINVVTEVMGGVNPARDYVLAAFDAGKHVVTANKELLAKHGRELWEAAGRHESAFRFEASVAAGIPIIKSLEECLASNRIQEIMGIVNGTTNYILTKMAKEGLGFDEALREAQAKGYAESDPSADVDGFDAAYKLAILASVGLGVEVPPHEIYVEGIRKVSIEDIRYAEELGFKIKLLAIAKPGSNGGLQVRVHPSFVPSWHPLASVDDTFNAVFVRGTPVGSLMFYGRGAGEGPTASAVVADIMDVARGLVRNGRHYRPEVFKPWGGRLGVQPIGELTAQYYVRVQVVDKPGVLAQIAKAFGDHEVSLESVIQKGTGCSHVALVFLTHVVREDNVQEALKKIRELPVVKEISNVIRVDKDMVQAKPNGLNSSWCD